jgi:hypothetical protein
MLRRLLIDAFFMRRGATDDGMVSATEFLARSFQSSVLMTHPWCMCATAAGMLVFHMEHGAASDQRRADHKNRHQHGLSVSPASSFAFVPQALSNCVWETVAPVRSAPLRSAPLRSAPLRSAFLRLVHLRVGLLRWTSSKMHVSDAPLRLAWSR